MLHVVCTGYHLWLFLLIARHSSKTVLILKKLMGHSTFAVGVTFLLRGVVKKSWSISHFTIEATPMIQASFTMLHPLSPMVMLSRSTDGSPHTHR